jgi:phospholipase/carboxylesterase
MGDDLGFVHRYVPAGRLGLPTLLMLHGTGGDENDLLPLGRMLLPGAAMLSPRGKVLEQGMPRFFRRLAEGVFDLEDLRQRALELADFVQGAAESYGFDARNVIAVGYSNGANIAAAMLLSGHRGVADAAVLLRAQHSLDAAPGLDLRGLPVLLLSGAADPVVPAPEAARLAAALRAGGAAVTHETVPAGHGLDPRDVALARRFLSGLAAPPG